MGDTAEPQEMEIQFQLDENGRTTVGRRGSSEDVDSASGSQLSDTSKQVETQKIDYSYGSCLTVFSQDAENGSNASQQVQREILDELLFDCEIADSRLMPRTFWISAEGFKPRCALEKMALDVFYHHVPSGQTYNPQNSGAEWWVQLRPSPPAGRYSACSEDNEEDDEMTKTGISFHWDKDEDLRLLTDGSMHIHPHLSTVTYLTDLGAPTMILSCRVNPLTGQWILPHDDPELCEVDTGECHVKGFISWPRQGKHMSFDGRYLHAAPPDLMHEGQFEEQCSINLRTAASKKAEGSLDTQGEKIAKRRQRRATFLVNLWLNHKPFNVQPFPDSMVSKMSKINEKMSDLFVSQKSSNGTQSDLLLEASAGIKGSMARTGKSLDEEGSISTTNFQWTLGDSEKVQVELPVKCIQEEASLGPGNLRLQWTLPQDRKATEHYGVLLSKNEVEGEVNRLSEINADTCQDNQTRKRAREPSNQEACKRTSGTRYE